MADKITYVNKESLVTDPTIAEKNKVTDNNMNEIKNAVNNNADQLDETIVIGDENITSNTKEVIKRGNYRYMNSEIAIGSSNDSNIPVWFKQGKNLINKEAWFFGYFGNTGSMNYSKNNATFNFIEVLPNTSYTFSINSNTTWFAITEFNDSTFIRRDTASSYPASQLTITTSATTNYVAISLNHSDSQMTQAKIDEREPQLELGTTATTYEDFITPEIITNNDNIFYTAPNEKWERLTLSSEFKNYNNDIAYQPKIKKEGNVVTIVGIVSPTADITNTSTEHTICSIPEQYRPRDIPVHQLCQASGMNRWLLIVGIGGNVTLSRYGITEMTTALANSWLPFTITYLV